ncbi:hypothetical protein SAMN05421510_11091, partial [Nitrosomonas ureae]
SVILTFSVVMITNILCIYKQYQMLKGFSGSTKYFNKWVLKIEGRNGIQGD